MIHRNIMQIKQKVASMGLKHKFILINIIIVVMIFLGTMIGMTIIINHYNEMIYKTTLDNLRLSTAGIDEKIKEIEKLSEYIVIDNTVQKELDQINRGQKSLEYKQTVSQLMECINKYLGTEHSIINISLIDTLGRQISSSSQKIILDDIVKGGYELAQVYNGKAVWYIPDTKDGNIICMREILKIRNLELTSLGVVMISVNLESIVDDNLRNLLSGRELEAGKIYIFHENEIIYPLNEEKDIENNQGYIKQQGYNISVLDGTKYLITYNNMKHIQLTYALLIPYDKIYRTRGYIKMIILVMALGFLVASIGISIILVDKLTSHLEHLVESMKKFRGDNLIDSFECEKYQVRKDEIGFLYTTFYEMAKNIDNLVNESLKKQILIKDTQLNHLVSQINPHFLYNTLNSINWIAKMNKQAQISQMVEALGILMRSAISEKSDFITLGKELELVKSYIFIQKVRYEERLTFHVEVEEVLLRQLIPKLCIQPLVENSINHVLEYTEETCEIEVKVQVENNQLIIIVSDNGEGIDENILQKLQTGEVKPKNTGIGLNNIQKRIELLYGIEYGLSFRKLEKRSQVRLHIPLAETKGEEVC